MDKRDYWAFVSTIDNIYSNKIDKLIKVLGKPEHLYHNSEKELKKAKIDLKTIKAIQAAKEKFEVKRFYEQLQKDNIKFVSLDDMEYPAKLLPYDHKPYYLFVKGNLPDANKPSVAIIGARNCTNYGRNMAKDIARDLSQNGVQVISGMARGIDTYSHIGALEGEAPTYAVLGCGVNYCYPQENIEVYNDILRAGGVISEYAINDAPLTWHFPQRNRIISGLADLIVVVEAREKSGSLITVEWALEQGKDIMAVPGRVCDKLSGGCNRLIKIGAGVVTGAQDILEELDMKGIFLGKESKSPDNIYEADVAKVYDALDIEPKNISEIIVETDIKYENAVECLLKLQLTGQIVEVTNGYYCKK